MSRPNSDEASAGGLPPKLTMKERAKKARHEAYVAAKERRKNDPRTAERKTRLKAARREASAKAKERRKNDPTQIALKEKRKQDRRAASALAKEQRSSRTKEAEKTARADRGEIRPLRIIVANAAPMPGPTAGTSEAVAEARARSLAAVRAALTVIVGGKSPRSPTKPS